MGRILILLSMVVITCNSTAQTKVQRGVARMITRTATDPLVPVQGVQVVVGNVANKASDKSGRFTMNIAVNREKSYQVTDVRMPKGSTLLLASPSKKKKLFLDNNELEVSFISQDEKSMVSRANYKKLLRKYNEQAEAVRKLREQLEERQAELDKNSKEYFIVKAKRDSLQKLLSLYFNDKTYEQTLKDIESIAEELALTDYQSLNSIETRIYQLKMEGDWATISDVLIRLMGGNASVWLHKKLDRRNLAAKDFAQGMEMIKEAIEAFKMQHLNDSVSKYYDILIKADSTNWENVSYAADFELQYMANYDKAMRYYMRMIDQADDDTIKAASYNGIGIIYAEHDGNYLKAQEYLQKGLDLFKKTLGENHSYLAGNYSSLGNIYEYQGNHDMALKCYQKALDIQIALSGEQHEYTALSYNGIGGVYAEAGNNQKALEYFQKSLDIREAVFGKDSPAIATSYNNMGEAHLGMGDYAKALSSFQKALEMRKTLLGEEHPDVAACYINIGLYYDKLCMYPKALEYYNKALNMLQTTLTDNHVSVATCLNNIASVYDSQGNYADAIECYEKALTIKQKVLGERHTDIAMIYNNIASTFIHQHNNEKALYYLDKSLEIYCKAFGEKNYYVALVYSNIGIIYDDQGEKEKALDYLKKSVEISEDVLGTSHPDFVGSYVKIGGILLARYDLAGALSYFNKALPLVKKQLGDDSEITQQLKVTVNGLKDIIEQSNKQ